MSELKMGDAFALWCSRMGRKAPKASHLGTLNADAVEGAKVLKEDAKVYRAYCSFLAGRGRKLVFKSTSRAKVKVQDNAPVPRVVQKGSKFEI